MDIPSGDTDVERLSMGAFCVAPKFEFSRQKLGYQPVGDGLEGSCTDFRPDRPTGGWMAAKILVAPNLNFPAKNLATNPPGMSWRGQIPIFGQIGRPASGWQPKIW